MADDVTLPGTGEKVATDDDGTRQHQYVKLEWGPDNTFTKVGTGGSAVPIQDGGNSITVDGAVDIADGGGSITVDGSVTADTELTTADLDTGAGTDTRAVVGLVGSKSGGGVLIPGDATAGLKVDLGADNDVTVTGSVNATLQAADNTVGRVKITDGTDVADVLDLTNSNPVATAIVDGNGDQITSFGGGVQYTEADTDASITGTAILWEDGSDTLRAVSAAKPLPVNVVAGGSSGTQYTEGDTDASITGTAILWEDGSDTLRAVSAAKPLPVGDAGGTLTVDDGGTTLSIDDGGGSVTVDGSVTADTELTTADLDTGGGTDTRAVVGLVGSKSGGAALIPGDATAGLKVDLGADNDVTVTGSVNATLQAADNTVGRVKLTDGTDVADVLDLSSSNPLAVAVVDASGDQIASFGGGTQYTEADTDASITGTAMLWEDTSDTLRAVSAAKPLPVNIISGASAGTQYTEGDTDSTITGTAILWEDGSDTLRAVSSAKPLPVSADTELTTADLDTGAGTDTRAVVGLVGSKSGGGVLIPGDATAGLKVDLGADNDVTVTSGSITADTELPAAAALADAASATPSTPTVGAVGLLMNATTLDRQRAIVAALDSTGTGIAAAGIVGQLDDASTATVTENQFAPVRISSRRALLVEGVASGTAFTVTEVAPGTILAGQVTVTNTTTQIVGSRSTRKSVVITNRQSVAIYIGATAATTSMLRLDPGDSVELPTTSRVDGITSAAYTASTDDKAHYVEVY